MDQIADDFFGAVRYALKDEITSEQIDKVCFKISDMCGGERVYISKQYHLRISVRNREIRNDHRNKLSVDRLATKYSLSKPQIHKIVSYR